MRFSIIMPSRLIPYPGCANYLDRKIVRSVRSVLDQTFTDFELIIVADGCKRTKEIIAETFKDERIVRMGVEHTQVFGNVPRNTGIDLARGEYIIYLDIDDYWGENHLSIIDRQLNGYDWVWYNDIYFNNGWTERACNIKSMGQCGTSNVCHKRSLGLKWDRPGYAHDYYFNQKLLRIKNGVKIETPEYYVCHIPGNPPGGYDK